MKLNESVECEFFTSKNDYVDEKCLKKSTETQLREATIRTFTAFAIVFIIGFYIFILLLDIHTYLTIKDALSISITSAHQNNKTGKDLKKKLIKKICDCGSHKTIFYNSEIKSNNNLVNYI